MTYTHTFAEFQVSPSTYDEVSRLLKDAGYSHAFQERGDKVLIDMHGIALSRGPETEAVIATGEEKQP